MQTSRSIRSQPVTSVGGWNSASMSQTAAPSVAISGKPKRRRINWNGGRADPGTRAAQEIRMRPGRRSEITNSSRTAQPSRCGEVDALRNARDGYFIPLERQLTRFGELGRNGAELWRAEAVGS